MTDEHHHNHQYGHAQPTIGPWVKTAIDPVCSMTVSVGPTTRAATFGDEDFYFCSDNCETKFETDPFYYASGNAKKAQLSDDTSTEWTCPM